MKKYLLHICAISLILFSWDCYGNCDTPFLIEKRDSMHYLNGAFLSEAAEKRADVFLKIIEEKGLESCELTLWIKYEKGVALQMNSKYEEGLVYFQNLIDEAQKLNFYRIVAESYIGKALIHEFLGRGEDCKFNLDKGKKLIDTYQLNESYPFYCVRYSSYSRGNVNLDTARYYALEAVRTAPLVGDKNNELDGYLLLGILTSELNKSLNYFDQAIRLYEDREGYLGAASQAINAAKSLMRNNKYSKAKKYIASAGLNVEKSEPSGKNYFFIAAAYYNLQKEIKRQEGQLDSALILAEKAADLKLQGAFVVDKEKVDDIEYKFAIQQEQTIAKQLEQESKWLKMALAFWSLFILLLGAMFYSVLKTRKKVTEQNELINKKNENLVQSNRRNEILLSEVHHRVKNNLQNIISLIYLKMQSLPEDSNRDVLQDFSHKVTSISLIHEQLYASKEFELIDLKEYIKNFIQHFQMTNSEIDFTYNLDFDTEVLNLDTALPIGFIFSELLTNSIDNHNDKKREILLTIRLNQEGDLYNFTYNDYSKSETFHKPQGLSMSIISSMTRQLQSKPQFTNENGLTFKMSFKPKTTASV